LLEFQAMPSSPSAGTRDSSSRISASMVSRFLECRPVSRPAPRLPRIPQPKSFIRKAAVWWIRHIFISILISMSPSTIPTVWG